MKILIANLKHFYQCRSVWWFYLPLCLILIPMLLLWRNIISKLSDFGITIELGYLGLFGILALLPFCLGFLTADLQRTVLAKPFSFCMPNHRSVPRRLMLVVGVVVVALLIGAIFIGHKEPQIPQFYSYPKITELRDYVSPKEEHRD